MNNEQSDDLKRQVFGFDKNIFFAGLTSFLTDTSTKMVYCIMPLFLLSIGASKTTLSLIEGIAESSASILKALSGFWSDKIGRNKPFMIIGYALSALITPIYSTAVSPLQILYLRFLERVGKGIRTAPRDSLVAKSSSYGKTGTGFGVHKAMDNCGAIVGPLISFLILLAFPGGYRRVFLFAAIPAFLGVLTIIFFIKEAKANQESLIKKIAIKDFSKSYYIFLIIVFIFTLGNSTDALLLVKANDIGIDITFIPIAYLIFNSVSVLLSVPMGRLADKIGKDKLIIFGYLIYSIVYYGFGRTSNEIIIVMLFSLYGVYSAATDGTQKAQVSDLLDKDKKGTGLGIYNSLLGITLLPASLIAGVLYDRVNSSVPFYFGAFTALAAAVMLFITRERFKHIHSF